jgi:hypothetical protein
LRADDVERALLLEAVGEAHRYSTQRDKALAHMIISELAEAVKRGRK